MIHSLRARLWWSFALVVFGVLCVTSAGLLVYLARNPAPVRLLYVRLEVYATILSQADRLPASRNTEKLLSAMERADSNLNLRLAVLAPDGTVIADTRPELGSLPVPTLAALKNPSRIPLDYRDASGKVWIYAARRMADNSVLITSSPRLRLTIAQLLQDEGYLLPLAQAGLVALAAALLLAIWLSGWITQPLRSMSQAMSAGKFVPIAVHGPSEVQEVSQAYNEMVQRVQASQQSQRDFIANVSHDLKTPLTSIQGFSQAILDGTASRPEELQQAAQIISSEAERMNRMVLDLLEIARLDARMIQFEKTPVDLVQLLEQIAAQFAPQAGLKGISIQTDLPVSANILGDHDRLAQVFTNLVDNALKFSPTGGRVRLSIEIKPQAVEVQVRDSGSGIPESELERIFDRFYQVDKSRAATTAQGSRRGFGLGLAIAREIIQAHNGKIYAYNQRATADVNDLTNSGSIFVVRLPIPTTASPASAASSKKRKATST